MEDKTSDKGCCCCSTTLEQNRILKEQIPVLQKAAECGDTNALYAVIAQFPDILKQMDDIQFLHSPLHAAACNNQIGFAMEVAMLMPSLARKLNGEGYSPMHLALQCGHIQIARSLLTIDTELVRVKGRDGFTPLHFAAQIDECGLVEEFLCSCPKSIEDLTSRCQTAMHVAVQNMSLGTSKYLQRWLLKVKREEVLRWKDAGGNTILHVAAFANNAEAMKLFIKNVGVNAKNLQDQTALDLAPDNVGVVWKILSQAGGKQGSNNNIMKQIKNQVSTEYNQIPITELRNIMLVVATLIASATYQAVLSPPGGYWSDYLVETPITDLSHASGPSADGQMTTEASLKVSYLQVVFLSANTVAFSQSIVLILMFTAGMGRFKSFAIISTSSALVITYGAAVLQIVNSSFNDSFNISMAISFGLCCVLPALYHAYGNLQRDENPLRRKWTRN